MIRVFAVGSPRSGTTLLQRLLAEEAGLATQRETFLVPRVRSRARALRCVGLARRDAVVVAGEAIGRPLGPVPWRDRYRTVGVVRAAAAALDAGAEERGAPGWVEKTPRHLLHVALLTEACHPRFVHIVRDGADVAVSIVGITERHPDRWQGPRTALDAARRWAADVEEHSRWADRSDHAFVRYEDVVADPGTWSGALARWLGPTGHRRTVDPSEIARPTERWKLTALDEVSPSVTTATVDRVAAAQALRDDPAIGPILAAGAAAAAALPYDRLLRG